jgi:hypothetical protein
MAFQVEILQLLSAVGWSARFDSNKREPGPNAQHITGPAAMGFHREPLACWALVEPSDATSHHRRIVGIVVSLTTHGELVAADEEHGFITYDSN